MLHECILIDQQSIITIVIKSDYPILATVGYTFHAFPYHLELNQTPYQGPHGSTWPDLSLLMSPLSLTSLQLGRRAFYSVPQAHQAQSFLRNLTHRVPSDCNVLAELHLAHTVPLLDFGSTRSVPQKDFSYCPL